MSKGATFKLDMAENVRFKRALSGMIGIEGKSAKETVKFMAIRIAMAGRSRTKLGKKFRDVIQNPDWVKRSGKPRYAIVRRRQGKKPALLPKYKKSRQGDKRAQISNRGLAKSSWGWVLGKLGKSKGRTYARGKGRKFVKVRKKFTSANPFVMIEIALSYIEKVHPGIVRQAVVSATNYVIKRQEQKLAKRLQKELRR